MADDTLQSGADTIATDHVSTLNGAAITPGPTTPKVQRVKVSYGDDGISRDVSAAFPLPTMDPDVVSSGTISAVSGTVVLSLNGQSGAAIQLTGTWTGTVQFEGTVDGTTWTAINAVAATTSGPQPTTTVNGLYRLTPGGLTQIRAFATTLTVGTITVSMRASSGTGGVFANQVMPVTAVMPDFRASSLAVTATAATGTALTLTLPAPGAGLFHYVTLIEMTLYSTAARTGTATPIVVTTTNLPGSLAFTFATAGAIGTVDRYPPFEPITAVKASAANTATTIVAPVVTGGIWRLTATYFTAA